MERDQQLKKKAEKYVKKHKNEIVHRVTDVSLFLPEKKPISIFMAGSPGAGKTEISRRLIEIAEDSKDKEIRKKIIRIDPDDFRSYLPGYTGVNSHIFQKAVSVLVSESHNSALKNNQSFLLDGTFSNYEIAEQNVKRSLRRNREVYICYVYQEPQVAWRFTQAREFKEGRRIEKETFIQKFLSARYVVQELIEKYASRITVMVVIKNFQTHEVEKVAYAENRKVFDDLIKNTYTEEDIRKTL